MGFEVGLQEHGANLARNAIGDWPDENGTGAFLISNGRQSLSASTSASASS